MKIFYRYKIFLFALCVELALVVVLVVLCQIRAYQMKEKIVEISKVGNTLKLTDLSVWTEARYARAPSQADLFNPFQDFPCSIEHFPAGSILSPPEHMGR